MEQPGNDVVEQLLERMEDLERANSQLRSEVARLRSDRKLGSISEVADREVVSRRGLLRKAGGAVAAGVTGAAVGNALGASPAAAADGGPVLLGRLNQAFTSTQIQNDETAARVELATGRDAVRGEQLTSQRGRIGVSGYVEGSDGIGTEGEVAGTNGIAVRGLTSGHHSQTAVLGNTTAGLGEGIGVHGKTVNGAGVRAEATGPGGLALQVFGPAAFSQRGKVSFAAGQASRTVALNNLRPTSIVLATIQGRVAGTFVLGVGVQATNSRFIIHLNKAAPANLTVGWFVVN